MCQSAKLCNMQSRGGCQQCLFLRSLPAAGHLCGPGEPAGHVPGHLWTAATLRGVLLQASSVWQNGNQTRGQCQIQPGRGKWNWLGNCLVLSNFFFFLQFISLNFIFDGVHISPLSFQPFLTRSSLHFDVHEAPTPQCVVIPIVDFHEIEMFLWLPH